MGDEAGVHECIEQQDTLSVYRKIFAVQKAIPVVKKDANNTHQGFDYVSSSAVLEKVRAAMDKEGLILLFDTIECKTEQGAAYKGKQALTTIKVVATWIDAENPISQVSMTWYGMGADEGEKGLGKALTYMEKYNLLKALHIPTDEVDPDADRVPMDNDAPRCPKCGKPMRIVNGNNGSFWGCTGYPKCKSTMNIEEQQEEDVVDTINLEDVNIDELWDQTWAVVRQVRGEEAGIDDPDTVRAMLQWSDKHFPDGPTEIEQWTPVMILKFKASVEKVSRRNAEGNGGY